MAEDYNAFYGGEAEEEVQEKPKAKTSKASANENGTKTAQVNPARKDSQVRVGGNLYVAGETYEDVPKSHLDSTDPSGVDYLVEVKQ